MKSTCGQLGWTPDAFWTATVSECILAITGKKEQEEAREQSEWERTRWLGYITLQPHDTKNRINRPRDLCRFPWEKIERSMSEAEARERIEKLTARWEKAEAEGRIKKEKVILK